MADSTITSAKRDWKPRFFWTLWSIEMLVLLLWLWDDLQLEFLSVNPVIYLGLFFLLLALAMKKLAGMDKVALIMVSIPGLLLGIMALFLLIVLVINTFFGPIRWN